MMPVSDVHLASSLCSTFALQRFTVEDYQQWEPLSLVNTASVLTDALMKVLEPEPKIGV
jgi:hypothetical protein